MRYTLAFLAVLASCIMPVAAQVTPSATYRTNLPQTCTTDTPASRCTLAITVTNPDGSNIGGTSGGGSAGDPSYTGTNGSTTIPTTIAVTGGWDGTNLRRFLTDASGRQVVNINGSVAVTGTFWQATQPVSGTVAFSNTTIGLSGTLPAYASIPTFKLDQTTPGTTNGVVVNSSVLPTGAATSANQTTELSTLSTISGQLPASLGIKTSAASVSMAPASDALFMTQGPVASGATASGNPVQTGCIFNTTQPTLTTGQIGACQLDNRANTKVALTSGTTALAADTSNAFGTSLSVTVGPSSNFSAGASVSTATATTAGLVIKASAGTLYGLVVVNSTTAGFVCVVNANAVPADGAVTDTTVLYAMPLAASVGIHESFNPPIPFSSGMSMFLSSSYCSTKTAIQGTKFLGYYK